MARYNHETLRAQNTPPVLSSAEFKNGKLYFAAGTDDEFVHHYRITLYKDGEPVALKKILADFYQVPLPSLMKPAYKLSLTDLKEGEYTAEIVAVDSWDAQSEPITCTFTVNNSKTN